MPALDMRRAAVEARYDLAYQMHERHLPITLIIQECGYQDATGAFRAIKAGRKRAANNERHISARMFGIEIEFNQTSRDRVCRRLEEIDPSFQVSVEGYNHRVTPQWKLITDGSVSGRGTGGGCLCPTTCEHPQMNGAGLEAVSPILRGAEGFEQLRTLVRAIRDVGGGVDRSCGLHVHHDARDMSPGAIAFMLQFYTDNQPVIDLMLAPSRRASNINRWCTGYSQSEKTQLVRQALLEAPDRSYHFARWDRYKTINVNAYSKYGSIEFRQHQGTLNIQKIINWVKFGQALVEASMAHSDSGEAAPVFTEVEPMLAWLVDNGSLPLGSKQYLARRAETYAR